MSQQDAEPIRARIRRWYVPDAIYFITGVTQARRPLFAQAANMDLLRESLRKVKTLYPFTMYAYAFLPEHMHMLIFVPATTNISKLMQSWQRNVTRNYKIAYGITTPLRLWQRGFWDHVIRDADDYERHFHYIHYNPVKHGLVRSPGDYPHTSFHAYVQRGIYAPDWGVPEDVFHDVRAFPGDFEPREM
jgi:putative transposase